MSQELLKTIARNKKKDGAASERKIAIFIKLAPSVISYFKSQGRGYQARINELLSEYVELARAAGTEDVAAPLQSPPLLSHDERIKSGQRLFKKFYAQCFWHLRSDLEVTEALLPLIAQGLRRHGGREGFLEAKQLCQ